MGTLAAIGVVINNNNVNSLSEDQDSICTSVRQEYLKIETDYQLGIFFAMKEKFNQICHSYFCLSRQKLWVTR